jgi:molybdopterin-containing oxidoreductase family membrane subunit
VLAVLSLAMLIIPGVRKREGLLAFAAVALFVSLWIDKGFGLIIGGFVPNMLNQVRTYWPTVPEALIALGVWSTGFFVLTMLYKIAVSVREETAGIEIEH